MQTKRNQGAIVPSKGVSIPPSYHKALAATAQHYQTMVEFVKSQMVEGIDYGVIPGTKKPTLLKPGSEKLCRLFSLRPSYSLIQSIADFEKPLFFYHYRCTLIRQGEMVGQGDGSCNSRENKYQKQSYKIYDLTNTICCLGALPRASPADAGSHRKMAQKRALVAAVLSSCGASQFFTQDLEAITGGES